MGVEVASGETPSLTGEFVGETHRVLECTQAHPPGNQHQKGPLCLWVAEGVTAIQWRVDWAPLLHLGLSPTYSITAQQPALPRPCEHLKLHPFTEQVCGDKKKKMAQMTEHFKAAERKNN